MKFLQQLLYIAIGIAITSFIIHRRLLVVRIPHEIKFKFNWILIIIAIFIITLSGISLYKQIYWNKEPSERMIKLLKPIIRLNKQIKISLEELFKIFERSYYIRDTISRIGDIYSNITIARQIKYIHFICNIFPRPIIAIALFSDIVIFNKFEYLYKVLILLLIPLIFKFIIYITSTWALHCYKETLEYLDVEEISYKRDDYYEYECNYMLKVGLEHIQSKENFMELIRMHELCLRILAFELSLINQDKKIFFRICTGIINIIYIVSWGYMLIQIL